MCQQMLALTTNTDKSVTQPLLNTVRSPLSRDLPSMQMLAAYSSSSNGSHIDTAPALRGLLYASAACSDMFEMDRTSNHFLRRENTDHVATHVQHVHAWPVAARTNVNIILVTLPAYTNHLKGHDAALAGAGWSIQTMDQTWCAVPVSTDIANSTYLLEYIFCFLDTSTWAGRLCRRVQTQHTAENGAQHNTHLTYIPHGHNVSIPGPKGVMLVLLDESVTARNSHLPIIQPEGVNVYPGSPYLQQLPNDLADYIVDATTLIHDLMNDYTNSALRMCHALEWMENNLCVDMAFQVAFSLAAELCNAIPESPTLEVGADGARRYTNPLNGAWTIGVHNFHNDSPRHTSSDINAGPLANRAEAYTSRVAGYDWAMVSPMLQYAMSATNVVHEAAVDNGVVVGYNSHWETPNVTESRPQYQCHVAMSCYRLMTALGLIEKNDYKFGMKNAAGLESMLVLQGAALSLSLSLYMTNNDIDRWMWSGLHEDNGVGMISVKNKIRTITLNHLLPVHAHNMLARNTRAGHTVSEDIQAYYALDIDRHHWAISIPIPYFATLQWASKFGLKTFTELKGQHGNVVDDYVTMYVEVTPETRLALPWYASTGNTFRRLPRMLSLPARAAPIFLPISVDDWAIQTIGRFGPKPLDNGFVANVFCTSLKYHCRDVNGPSGLLVLSGPVTAPAFASTLWGVTPTEYPDPPNMSFLYKAVSSAVDGVQKESPMVQVRIVRPNGPVQVQPIEAAPVAAAVQDVPPENPVQQQAQRSSSPQGQPQQS